MNEKRSLDEILKSIYFLVNEAKNHQIPYVKKDISMLETNIELKEEKKEPFKNEENSLKEKEKNFLRRNESLESVKKNSSVGKKEIEKINLIRKMENTQLNDSVINKSKTRVNRAGHFGDWSKIKFSNFNYKPRKNSNNLFYIEKYIEDNSHILFEKEIKIWVKKKLPKLIELEMKKLTLSKIEEKIKKI